MSRIAKTNIGTNIFKTQEHISQGSPNTKDKKVIYGTVRAIYYPGMADYSNNIVGGQGIQVQIDFDTPFDGWWKSEKDPIERERKRNYWFTCEPDYESTLANQG
ncbi:MAG: hypothetical protein EB127_31265, partial [Alphaproteobacteria bacterium]|nr:hypothetical protein [Alphaproteobacteria bacterium]